MIFWIIVILLAVHIAAAFFMSPPTAWANWFFDKFATHPKLRPDDVTDVFVGEERLGPADRASFIEDFNGANFLYEGGVIPQWEEQPVDVKIVQGKATFLFKMYLYGDEMVEVVRYRKKKYTPYRVRSGRLEQFLRSYRAA
ncbi:YfmQ family protein [Alicyclobacillus fastidiosus]|uniref:YfmQ family protein n=1 Tax=Alicyclobacillus fastidiosus TaxID=392011 RepID=A0ABV5AHB6_9BACL|nr:YfmQ family protein [Alicyclobacillus fastidiosus]WEH07855.1 YfmQ family protein [Alicyclobacillus fastidiosus]